MFLFFSNKELSIVSKAISKSENTDIVCNVLSMAVSILSTKSVNTMAVEYPSLRPYWFPNNDVNFLCTYLNFF